MRRLVDILVVLSVLVTAGVIFQHRSAQTQPENRESGVRQSLTRLYERASYFGALSQTEGQAATLWPSEVLPSWFGSDLPINGMLPGVDGVIGRPWLDLAPPGDDAVHPPDPVAVELSQAQFWYNPELGIFRARVPATLGEQDALSLYNRLNGVDLAELHRDASPERRPLAYQPQGVEASVPIAEADPRPGLEMWIESGTPRRFTPADDVSSAPAAEPVPTPRGRARMKSASADAL